MILANSLTKGSKMIAFDVYGTLIDVTAVNERLRSLVGEKSAPFTAAWRSKQLEYTYRRGLMKNYVNFNVCTRQALDFTCGLLDAPIAEKDKQALIALYDELPPFPDVETGLKKLLDSRYRLFAFSNGVHKNLTALLSRAKIIQYFEAIVSVDDIQSFKPDPAVYAYLLRKTQTSQGDSWFISSNPFDVIGSLSFGMPAVWLKRTSNSVFDPWEIQPPAIIDSLNDLYDVVEGAGGC